MPRPARRSGILPPGGRYVQTNWQASDPHEPRAPRRSRDLDFAQALIRAGFTGIVIKDRPDLAHHVIEVFRVALERTADHDDSALRHLQDEVGVVLAWLDSVRRVLITAERP